MVAELDADELRELHPAELILACAGVRHAPPYDGAALEELRAANERLRGAAADPSAAARADDEFHRRLTERCGEPELLGVLERVRRELDPYRREYLAGAGRVARSADEHDLVIGALERGDRREAESRVRDHLATAFGELASRLERAGRR